jgi:hypothetical protein
VISEENKARARHHLGYGQVQEASTFVLGVPAAVQTAFMIEGTWSRIMASGEEHFCRLLDRLDGIEDQILEDQPNLAAEAVGTIKLNMNEFRMLLQQYSYWQGAVANLLQIPANPFDQRPFVGASGGCNIPTIN